MIWLIGGTRESREIAQLLSDIPYLVTVTTEEARSLYSNLTARVKVGALKSDEIKNLLEEYQIEAIIDASHPYAEIISQQAIEVSQRYNIPYLRYERPSLHFAATQNRIEVESIDSVLNRDEIKGQRVLLSIGYKVLGKFQHMQQQATLFTKILPSLTSLQAAISAGFTPDRIISIRPPLDIELEKALWQQWKIETVVTKANGEVGGEALKQKLAQELGIKLIVITRPKITYPRQTDNLEEVVCFLSKSDKKLR